MTRHRMLGIGDLVACASYIRDMEIGRDGEILRAGRLSLLTWTKSVILRLRQRS